MIVLGVNHGEINSSAALVRDGRLVAGAPEERFSRQTLTKVFPGAAIRWMLERENLTLPGLDAVAQAWNPGATWAKYNPLVSTHRGGRESYFYGLPDNLWALMPRRLPGDWVKMEFGGSDMPPVYFVQRHRSHAANAFFLSPFEDAAILTVDFRGELECTTFAQGRGTGIKLLGSQLMPNSLGMFYATFTELLGFKSDCDEWKATALSAVDVDHRPLLDTLRTTYRLCDGGRLELDHSCYQGGMVELPHLFSPKLVELMGGRVGLPGEDPGPWHFAVAKAMQAATEEIVAHFVDHLHALTGGDNLVLGGGFFMNPVVTGRLARNAPFKNVFVGYAPGYAGNSIGAALYVAHAIHGQSRSFAHNPSAIGPEFGHDDAVRALTRRGIAYEVAADPAEAIAAALAADGVVAVVQGRMEFGDRALGNRSILGDPRNPMVKDRINSATKYREAYRPFAPVVPEERVGEYFDVPPGFTCRYQEKVVPVREEWRQALAAVTHVDGSGRVQTVDKGDNPRFHAILDAFGRRTGVPVVLNTSFNVNGEPIALSPDDALTTFFNSGLDTLVIEDCVVRKSGPR